MKPYGSTAATSCPCCSYSAALQTKHSGASTKKRRAARRSSKKKARACARREISSVISGMEADFDPEYYEACRYYEQSEALDVPHFVQLTFTIADLGVAAV